MIELTYQYNEQPEDSPTLHKYFKTWKSLDKYVMSKKLNKYKVKGQSAGGGMIQYTSVLWEDFKSKFNK
jgi:hypothetical protein